MFNVELKEQILWCTEGNGKFSQVWRDGVLEAINKNLLCLSNIPEV
jgi:hypothetical protein